MPYVQSEAIQRLTYDDKSHRLRATFRSNGRTYEYENVPPELYDGLIFADSIGAFFNAHIRDRYAGREIANQPVGRFFPSGPAAASSALRSNSSAALSNFAR